MDTYYALEVLQDMRDELKHSDNALYLEAIELAINFIKEAMEDY